MDKVTTKRLLASSGIPLPGDAVWRQGDDFPQDTALPVVAKFPEGGSTLGLHIVHDPGELEAALLDLAKLGDEVLLEQFIEGDEITVAVLDGEALPVIGIVPNEGFFDFEAKYTEGTTRYEMPATTVGAGPQALARKYAAQAYQTLGLSGIARADFIVDDQGVPWFLEINTIPGMTATSLSPMAASCIGVSFEDLVERLLLGARLHLQPAF
jgi:D-alanine-D-alanine ligase